MERFPECVLESGGDLVVDCIELMCGKKIQFVKSNDTPGTYGDLNNSAGSHNYKGGHPPYTPATAGGTISSKRYHH